MIERTRILVARWLLSLALRADSELVDLYGEQE